MFAVIFEVNPKPEQWDTYLGYARALRPELERIDGFLDNERFSSMRRPGWLLSLSAWRDEKAVIRWRTQAEHHGAQEKGRFEVFEDYRLRVGEITADSAPDMELAQQRFDETQTGDAKAMTITEVAPSANTVPDAAERLATQLGLRADAAGLVDCEAWDSIYTPGKLLLLASWRDADAAKAWVPSQPDGVPTLHHRQVRIIRDYGMFERREAPQYYAEASKSNAEAATREGDARRALAAGR